MVIQPGSDLIAGDLTLTRTIRVNVLSDVAGRIQTVFDAGSRVEPVTATLQLSGSRLTRYPVDNYLVNFKLLVQREIDPGEGQAIPDQPEFENVPIVATVQSSLSDLRASGTTHPGNESNVLNADFDLERPRSVVVFAVALMGLAWLLALGCVALAWGVLVQAREIPVWSWGFYAGVLFALPQLRNGLPGSPPFGSIIDWAAYYWALGLVGVSLLALILAGNVAIRSVRTDSDAELEPDSDPDPDPDRGDSGPQSPALARRGRPRGSPSLNNGTAPSQAPLSSLVVVAEAVDGIPGLLLHHVNLVGVLAARLLVDEVPGFLDTVSDLVTVLVDHVVQLLLGIVQKAHVIPPSGGLGRRRSTPGNAACLRTAPQTKTMARAPKRHLPPGGSSVATLNDRSLTNTPETQHVRCSLCPWRLPRRHRRTHR